MNRCRVVHGGGRYFASAVRRLAARKSRASVNVAVLQWVHWFNHTRLLESIGYIPPAEAEANYWQQLAQKQETASST